MTGKTDALALVDAVSSQTEHDIEEKQAKEDAKYAYLAAREEVAAQRKAVKLERKAVGEQLAHKVTLQKKKQDKLRRELRDDEAETKTGASTKKQKKQAANAGAGAGDSLLLQAVEKEGYLQASAQPKLKTAAGSSGSKATPLELQQKLLALKKREKAQKKK